MYRGCFSLGCMCKTGWGKAVLEDIQTYTYVTNQIMYLHLGRLSLGNLVKKDLLCQDCYKFSQGKAIFSSGTRFPPVEVQGRTRVPGQVTAGRWFHDCKWERWWKHMVMQHVATTTRRPLKNVDRNWQKSQKAKHGTTGPRRRRGYGTGGEFGSFFPSNWRKIWRPGKVNNFFIFPGMSFGAVLLGRS